MTPQGCNLTSIEPTPYLDWALDSAAAPPDRPDFNLRFLVGDTVLILGRSLS